MAQHSRYSHTLRFDITPRFGKCRAVVPLKLHLVPVTASRPAGCQNRPYVKWPSLGTGASAARASRSLVRPTRGRLGTLAVFFVSGI